jgi:hypothetical protein
MSPRLEYLPPDPPFQRPTSEMLGTIAGAQGYLFSGPSRNRR